MNPLSAFAQAAQWPINLYANLNPADGWRQPGATTVNPPVAREPQTVQNNLAMLTALNDMNWNFVRSAREIGIDRVNDQALQIAAQDRTFVQEIENRMRAGLQYNQNGAPVFVTGELAGRISLLI